MRVTIVLLSLLLPQALFAQRPGQVTTLQPGAAANLSAPVETAETRIQRAITILEPLIAQPTPAAIKPAQIETYRRETLWLTSVRDRLQDHLAERLAVRQAGAPDMALEIAKLDSQFVELHHAILSESHRFEGLTGAARIRHETAMNAIRNLRA